VIKRQMLAKLLLDQRLACSRTVGGAPAELDAGDARDARIDNGMHFWRRAGEDLFKKLIKSERIWVTRVAIATLVATVALVAILFGG